MVLGAARPSAQVAQNRRAIQTYMMYVSVVRGWIDVGNEKKRRVKGGFISYRSIAVEHRRSLQVIHKSGWQAARS